MCLLYAGCGAARADGSRIDVRRVRRYGEFSIGAGAHVQTVTEQRSKRDATAAPRAAWKSYGIQREIQSRRGGWAREGIGTQYNGGDGDGAEPLPSGVHESVNGPGPLVLQTSRWAGPAAIARPVYVNFAKHLFLPICQPQSHCVPTE